MENKGIQIEDVYMCPLYGTQGKYTKELFLIKECDCRKPKPGLLKKAGEKYNIDWENSYMVGDRASDIQMGQNAGIRTVLLESGYGILQPEEAVQPDYILRDLRDFIKILKKTG